MLFADLLSCMVEDINRGADVWPPDGLRIYKGVVGGGVHTGADHPNAKLTETDVREILSSTDSTESLARRYPVSHQTIRRIRRRLKWRHIES